jgi:hypothetical protein
VQAIYHICPNVSRDEVAYARAVAAAARTHGVKRFVYHSVLHPQIEAMPHHWQKMRVEEMLFVAGFDLTVLQPFIVEARPRLGGRAWTVTNKSGFALDLGCNCGSVGRCRRATGRRRRGFPAGCPCLTRRLLRIRPRPHSVSDSHQYSTHHGSSCRHTRAMQQSDSLRPRVTAWRSRSIRAETCTTSIQLRFRGRTKGTPLFCGKIVASTTIGGSGCA